MENEYSLRCLEKNQFFGVYHGKGKYISSTDHYDMCYTLTYFKSCLGSVKVEGKTYSVKSGDIIVMCPYEIHSFLNESDIPHERISIHINNNFTNCFPFPCEELFDFFLKRSPGNGNLIKSDAVSLHNIEKLIESIFLLSEKNKTLCFCKIAELLFELNNTCSLRTETTENETISKVIAYIGAHFTENINSTQISEMFFMSRSRLEHLFKQCTGVSLWDYVILRRIIFFNELVRNGFSTKQAFFKTGFKNYSNFYRLYKKHMGFSPSDYKEHL